MNTKPDAFENVNRFAQQVSTKQYHVDSPLGKTAYEKKLQSTHDQLRTLVKQQRDLLNSLRSKQSPRIENSSDQNTLRQTRLRELQSAKAAYDKLCSRKPFLPRPDSSLPALVTLRKVNDTITEYKSSIPESASRIEDAIRRRQEEVLTKKALIARRDDLQQRLADLRDGVTQVPELIPDPAHTTNGEETIEARIAATQARIKSSTRSRNDMQRSLESFISTHLSTLLAIEDLGGPQVGEAFEDSRATLRELIKARDEPLLSFPGTNHEDSPPGSSSKKRKTSPSDARESPGLKAELDLSISHAKEDMSELLSELMNVFIEDGGTAYVEMRREMSAVAYLERIGVVERSPDDKLSVRLVDFVKGFDE